MSPKGTTEPPYADDPGDDSGLVADNLGKAFRSRQVVKGVSLSLKRGEVVGLLGPNGAGKTTCFYMITGLIRVDHGHILIDGQDVTGLPMYQRARLGVGYLPQEASIFRGLTVEENVAAIAELTEKNATARKETVNRLLNELRIDHLRKQAATSLSGGERRRVEIARARLQPLFHVARRTVRRHRSHRHQRHQGTDRLPEGARHRHSGDRSQRA
jgi:lipopolysaccharide export system ATP-binding protein